MKTSVLFSVALSSTLLLADTYEWNAADKATSLGNGAVTVEWEGDKVKSFSKTAAGDVTVTGDSLDLIAGGVVKLSSDNLFLKLPISSSGALTFYSDNRETSSAYEGEPLSGKTEKLVFVNMNIDEWEPLYCIYNKNNWNNLNYSIEGTGAPYHIVRSEGFLKVQYQCVDDGYVKSVEVTFVQKGEDVWAKITHSKYISGVEYLGKDFNNLEGSISYPVAVDNLSSPNDYGRGYSVDYFLFSLIDSVPSSIVVENGVDAGATITNGAAAALVFSGDSALSASGEYAGDFYVSGKLVFRDRFKNELSLSGKIYGDEFKTVSFESSVRAPTVKDAGSVTLLGTSVNRYNDGKEYLYIDDNWHDVVTNVPIAEVTAVTGHVFGPNIVNEPNPHVYFVSNSVDNLTKYYQFQVLDGAWFKTMDVELTEVKPELNKNYTVLRARVKQAQYCAWNQVPGTNADEKFGYILTLEDAENKGGRYYGISGYCVRSVTVGYGSFNEKIYSRFELANTNNIEKGVIEVKGSSEYYPVCLGLSNNQSLPAYGALNIRENGIVEFRAEGTSHYKGYKNILCPVNIFPGGELRQMTANAFGSDGQVVNNQGGTLVFGYGQAASSSADPNRIDSKTYLQVLNLSDCAKVEGTRAVRVAYNRGATWKSSGVGPNIVNCPFLITGADAEKESYFDLYCDSDLVLNGKLMSYADIWKIPTLWNCVVRKYGSAKTVQNNICTVRAPVRIYGGAWVLGASALVESTKVFELHGGALELADGVEYAFDVLPLKADAACGLKLGEGAKISLGRLSFESGGATLEITGPAVKDGARTSVRVGESAILSAEECAKIRYNAKRVTQDAEGYIRTAMSATVVLVK
jgi:hypothetical protein